MKLLFIFFAIIIIAIFNNPVEKFANCSKCKLHYFCLLTPHLRRKCFWHKEYKQI